MGFAVINTEQAFAREMVDGFTAGVGQVDGVRPVVAGPATVDPAAQLMAFQQLTEQAPSGICVFATEPELFAGPLAQAHQRGIPVIAVDNVPPPSSNVGLLVANDNYQLGRTLAAEVAAKLTADTGTIVIGTPWPGVPVLDQRANGIRDEIRARLPKVTVRGPFDTRRDPASNLAAWTSLVRANPKALAFLGTGEADGYNLAALRRKTHGTWAAGAFDVHPKSLQAVKAGDLVVVSPEHFLKGAVAGRLQAQHATRNGSLPAGWLPIPGLVVNGANVDQIIARQVSAATKQQALAQQIDRLVTEPPTRPLQDAT